MQLLRKVTSRERLRKFLIGMGICLVLYTIVGFLALPWLIEWILAKKLSEQLHRHVTIADVDVNPYVLSSAVKGFVISEREDAEAFVSFDHLYANLQIISIFKRAPIVKELRIEGLYLNVIRESEGRYNFSDLATEKPSAPKESESGPFMFSLHNIQLLNGRIHLLDMPNNKKHQVTDLNITIPVISNLPARIDTFVETLFSAKINERAVSLKGKTKPFADSLETILDIILDDIDIPYYLAYIPLEWQAKVLKGQLSTNLTLSYRQYVDGPPTLSVAGDVFLKTLEIVDEKDRPLLNFPLIQISMAPSEVLSKNFHLAKLLLESPQIGIVRDQTGGLSLRSLIPENEGEKGAPSQETQATPVVVTVDEIALGGGSLVFSDFAVGTASEAGSPVSLKLAQINITAKDISTVRDTKGKVDFACQLNDKAPLAAEATIGITPFSADADLSIEGVQVGWLQPYFTDEVKIMVTNGAFSTAGKLTLSESAGQGLGVRYLGHTALSDFVSVDKLHADDFIKWGALSINDMDFGYNPTHVRMKEFALKDFYAGIIVNPDRKTNLQAVMKEKEEEKEGTSPPAKGKGPVTPVSVGKIILDGVRISFLDRRIEPNYSSSLAEIKGAISGLSSEETATAEVLLEGKLDNYAPVEIKGKINPLAEDLFVDLEIAFKDMDLSPISPYTGKYVGHVIEKGKLFLDLKYLIEKRKLDSQNRLFIDQLTFGDKVESPDAVNLPVGLAVALLKDRNGEIHLDLPVSGHTDDPEFRVGKVIVKMLLNLLTKAATSPFSLLGAVIGGGEELSALEFDYGSYQLSEQTTKKLDAIITALYERPSLRLDIEGHIDTGKDTEAWREYLFNKKLKAVKLKEWVKKGAADISVDDVTIEPDEYEKYLKKVYKTETFEKPKNVLGLAKGLPVPEMETLIRDHIEVSENDLRFLALQRAQHVKDYILQSGKVEPERVFLLEAKSLSPEKKEHLSDSRVNLKLK